MRPWPLLPLLGMGFSVAWGATGTFRVAGDPAALNGAAWTFTDTTGGVIYDLTGTVLKPAGNGPFPVVIVNHGTGGNASGYSRNAGREMVKWGYMVFAPNYTHSDDVPCGLPGDCTLPGDWGASAVNVLRGLKALELLARLPYADTSSVMSFGHSRGAWLTTALAAAAPARFRAAGHTAGGVVPDNATGSAARDSMALKIRCPYLMHHGDTDRTVALSMDRRLDSLLQVAKVVHRLDVYPGYDHNDIPFDSLMFARTRAWFDLYRSAPAGVHRLPRAIAGPGKPLRGYDLRGRPARRAGPVPR